MQRKERGECVCREFCINFEKFEDHPPHLKLPIDLRLRPYLGAPKEELPVLEVRRGAQAEEFDRLLLETMAFSLGSCVLQAFLGNASANVACFVFSCVHLRPPALLSP